MKLLAILLLTCVAFAAAPDVRTVGTGCSPACTYTTLQLAADAVATARASVCKNYIIQLTAGQSFTQTDLPVTGGVTCRIPIVVQGTRISEIGQRRIDPTTDTAFMPDVLAGIDGYALRFGTVTGGAANYWIFEGIIFSTSAVPSVNTATIYGETDTGNGTVVVRAKSQLASNIHFRRVIIRNPDPERVLTRSIAMNCINCSVTDSYLDGAVGQEMQAVQSCEGDNINVRNNFLRASGESALIGGCVPIIGTSKSTISGYTHWNVNFLGNRTEMNPAWKTDTTCAAAVCVPIAFASLPVPCYGPGPGNVGEYARTTTGASTWARCNNGGLSWTDSVAAPASSTVSMANKNHIDIKDGRGFRIRGNWGRYGWYISQAGQCLMINSSPTQNVYNLMYEYNRCQDTIMTYGHAISNCWNCGLRQNKSWNMAPPHTGGGPLPRHSYSFSPTLNQYFGNNSVHYYPDSDEGTYVQIQDASKPFETGDGAKGHTVWLDNVGAAPAVSAAPIIIGGSSWGIPPLAGSWCFATDPFTGWIYPNNSWSFTGQVWGGSASTVTPPLRPLVGGNCSLQPIFPTGTLTANNSTDVYVDGPNGDLTLKAGAWTNAGHDGRNPGMDTASNEAMAGPAATGARNSYLDFDLFAANTSAAAGGTATIDFVPVVGQTCTATASTSQAFGSTVGTATYPRLGRASITGIGSGARWLRITCGPVIEQVYRIAP